MRRQPSTSQGPRERSSSRNLHLVGSDCNVVRWRRREKKNCRCPDIQLETAMTVPGQHEFWQVTALMLRERNSASRRCYFEPPDTRLGRV
jgi:hypothetical protein